MKTLHSLHSFQAFRSSAACRDRPTAKRWAKAGLLLLALLATACTTGPLAMRAGSNTATATPAATVQLLNANGSAGGEARLYALPAGTELAISVSGLTPGLHGFHIHMNGECGSGFDAATGRTVAFGAAGGHFDPGNSKTHGQPGGAMGHNHAGDLPNLNVDADGRGTVRYVNPNVTIAAGAQSIVGRALVVHADPDDYATNPAGNSGTRVLCGVIKAA